LQNPIKTTLPSNREHEESQRLDGSSVMAKVVDESPQLALAKLDRHYEKLERVLQSGEVRATAQVKM